MAVVDRRLSRAGTSMAAASSPRRGLEAMLALGVAGVVAWFLVDAVSTALTYPQTTDYVAFATGGRVLDWGSTCLYCLDTQASLQNALLGFHPAFTNLFVNPPLAALAMRPFGSLALGDGLRIFEVISLLSLAASALLIAWWLIPRDWPASRRVLAIAVSVTSLPALTALRIAQWDSLLLLATVAAVVIVNRSPRAMVMSGFVLSLLLVKPQLAWLILPVLLVAGLWRLCAGFAAGAAAWLLSSVAIIGPGQLRTWVDAVRDGGVAHAEDKEGLPGLVAGFGGSTTAAYVAAAVLALGGLWLCWRMRESLHGDAQGAIAVAIALSVVCSPHTYPDDLILLTVAMVLWCRRAPLAAIATSAVLSVAWLIDVHLPTVVAWRHVESLCSGAIVLGLFWAMRTASAPTIDADAAPPFTSRRAVPRSEPA
ncbi:MAG TPA: glycosyltransferase family 87 protein [Candidatus Dormibacteraeota bacterium]|nr:glycosyltransferase family 87 protein [Candidatus Dormibacteraeota bacterium]